MRLVVVLAGSAGFGACFHTISIEGLDGEEQFFKPGAEMA